MNDGGQAGTAPMDDGGMAMDHSGMGGHSVMLTESHSRGSGMSDHSGMSGQSAGMPMDHGGMSMGPSAHAGMSMAHSGSSSLLFTEIGTILILVGVGLIYLSGRRRTT